MQHAADGDNLLQLLLFQLCLLLSGMPRLRGVPGLAGMDGTMINGHTFHCMTFGFVKYEVVILLADVLVCCACLASLERAPQSSILDLLAMPRTIE
jgi:hypothetical protein